MARSKRSQPLYVGVDVGGTKILAAVVTPGGGVLARKRCPTPRAKDPKAAIRAVAKAVRAALDKAGVRSGDVAAIGLAVPGVVEPKTGRVLVAPNVHLGGLAVVPALRKYFRVPIALGNDVNLGTLGEKWLGAARDVGSVVGIFVGTGIGGGILVDGRLLEGSRGAAAEVGHMILQPDGPQCGCGAKGCFEALAGRLAIERDIRAAVAGGKKSVVTELLEDEGPGPMRSSVLKEALARKDRVVTAVMKRAAEIIGAACVSLVHVLDPQAVVLGGGVMEACGDFIFPIVESILQDDPLMKGRPPVSVFEAALGDDAVALGAAAVAQRLVGVDPLTAGGAKFTHLPPVRYARGRATIAGETYTKDVYVRLDGQVKKRKKSDDSGRKGSSREVGPLLLEKVCKGGPAVVFVGTGRGGQGKVTDAGRALLARRNIELAAAPTPQAVAKYNASPARRAILLHLGS